MTDTVSWSVSIWTYEFFCGGRFGLVCWKKVKSIQPLQILSFLFCKTIVIFIIYKTVITLINKTKLFEYFGEHFIVDNYSRSIGQFDFAFSSYLIDKKSSSRLNVFSFLSVGDKSQCFRTRSYFGGDSPATKLSATGNPIFSVQDAFATSTLSLHLVAETKHAWDLNNTAIYQTKSLELPKLIDFGSLSVILILVETLLSPKINNGRKRMSIITFLTSFVVVVRTVYLCRQKVHRKTTDLWHKLLHSKFCFYLCTRTFKHAF